MSEQIPFPWQPRTAPARVTPAKPRPTPRPAGRPTRRLPLEPLEPLPTRAAPDRQHAHAQPTEKATSRPGRGPVPTAAAAGAGATATAAGPSATAGLSAATAAHLKLRLHRRETLLTTLDLDEAEFDALVAAGHLLEVQLGPTVRYLPADALPEAASCAVPGAAPTTGQTPGSAA